MALEELTTAAKIRAAIRKYERLGRDGFLAEYGYGRAREYFLEERGREYDSKAIFGVACGMEHGEFSGGEQTVERALRWHGFRVIHASAHWYEEELVLVLEWYMRHRARELGPEDIEVQTLGRMLVDLATHKRRFGTVQWRRPADVVEQLDRFRELDAQSAPDPAEPSLQVDVWLRFAAADRVRRQSVEAISTSLESLRRDARQSRRLRGLTGTDAAETRFEYRPRGRAREEPRPSTTITPGDLEGEYQGPRPWSPRRRGRPTEDDPEKHERAGRVHERVRDSLATLLSVYGFTVREPSKLARHSKVDYDLGAWRGPLRLLVESKSMPTTGIKTETRRLRAGLGQVIWYRQRYAALCSVRPVAVLLVDRQPAEHEAWLAVCLDVGVVLTWPERFETLIDACEHIGVRE